MLNMISYLLNNFCAPVGLNLCLPPVNNIKKHSILIGCQSGQQKSPSVAVAAPLLTVGKVGDYSTAGSGQILSVMVC